MDKFLLIFIFIIKIFVIILAPIILFIFRKSLKSFIKIFIYIEIFALLTILALYIIGFSYIVDSNVSNVLNIKLLDETEDDELSSFNQDIEISNNITTFEGDSVSYKTHKNDKVYYYNGYEMPLSVQKIKCKDDYSYLKHYSSIITSTSMLLSTYFGDDIDPIELMNKSIDNGLIDCSNPMNKDKFFEMISREYKVNFAIIDNSQLQNYILNGRPVMVETKGNGILSCKESYFLVYDINNTEEYLLLDPNNKSYEYICPDGTSGFGNILQSNYNDKSFKSSEILNDTKRLIVIGGTR